MIISKGIQTQKVPYVVWFCLHKMQEGQMIEIKNRLMIVRDGGRRELILSDNR